MGKEWEAGLVSRQRGSSNLTVDLASRVKTEIVILLVEIMESNLEHSYNGISFNDEREMSYKVTKRYGKILNAYFLVKEASPKRL